MISSLRPYLFAGALVWLAALVFAVALCRAAANAPWWERTAEQIDDLPEADPEDPRGRPSQAGRT